MKILLLTSGGDAPGMNRFIFDVFKKNKDTTFFAYGGFEGLVNGQFFPLKDVINKNLRDEAGTVIKSSRCPEFKKDDVFALGLANAKQFDVVIILGGNGSEKGAKRLYENGVNTIFVPGTIDNDVDDSFYSIGFSTAVKEGVYAVQNSMPSIQSFNMSCIFEVMGRNEPDIARAVSEKTNADYVIAEKKDLDFEKIGNLILKNYLQNRSTCIIARENIMDSVKIAKELNETIGIDLVKYQLVGRTQRGGKPTQEELTMASKFAKEANRCIRDKVYGVRILADKNYNIFLDELV
ncbi:MAG: 6-phosphofructokinase [Clostridia bacterium]|nr:6-phosphofructokinase [Clostridia bacterium]